MLGQKRRGFLDGVTSGIAYQFLEFLTHEILQIVVEVPVNTRGAMCAMSIVSAQLPLAAPAMAVARTYLILSMVPSPKKNTETVHTLLTTAPSGIAF